MKIKFILQGSDEWKVIVKMGPHSIEEVVNTEKAKGIAKFLGVALGSKSTIEVEIFP